MLLNLDGLVGQTHHFGGLAIGNLASAAHEGNRSNPRQAALQGLEKMWQLQRLGFAQGVLPPAQRPDLTLLRAAGFIGDDSAVIYQASQKSPHLLSACYSASSMWAANAATVTPATDTQDRQTHLTTANLISSLHRSLESPHNRTLLQRIFPDHSRFIHHPPLPAQASFGDEGAANHIRLSDPAGNDALNLFVYGRDDQQTVQPGRFPPRQSLLASQSIARHHRIASDKVRFIQQSPAAINAGAFHNDVVAVGFENLLILHQQAFANQQQVLHQLREKTSAWQQPLQIIEIPDRLLSLPDAVSSYLFNSQLLRLPSGGWLLVAPQECTESPAASRVIEELLCRHLERVIYFNLRESMCNGGGPACLRLAVPISASDLQTVHPGIRLTESLYQQLQQWIVSHYRDQLLPSDLADPALRREVFTALDSLAKILQLPALYPFQH